MNIQCQSPSTKSKMSSSTSVLSVVSVDRSTCSNPGTPTTSVCPRKFPSDPKSQKKPIFESPPPSYTRDLAQVQKLHLPDEDLCISSEEGVDSFLSRSLVHVQVEHNNVVRDFYVHRDLLLARSPFFKEQASRSDTLSVQSPWCQTIRLSDVRPATFGIYINLLYMKRLTTKGPKEWHWLCRLYILAEKLQDIESKNTVIDGMFLYIRPCFAIMPADKESAILDATSTTWLYEQTPENSPVRRFVVDFCVQSGRAEWLQAEKGKFPAEFVWDVAMGLMRQRPSTLFVKSEVMSPACYYETPSQMKEPKKLDRDREVRFD